MELGQRLTVLSCHHEYRKRNCFFLNKTLLEPGGECQPRFDPPSPQSAAGDPPFSVLIRFVLVLLKSHPGSAIARWLEAPPRGPIASVPTSAVQWEMAPSSKSEKGDSKQKAQKKHKEHVVKLLVRGRVGPAPVLPEAPTVTTLVAR